MTSPRSHLLPRIDAQKRLGIHIFNNFLAFDPNWFIMQLFNPAPGISKSVG
jgi:hypothetical protein